MSGDYAATQRKKRGNGGHRPPNPLLSNKLALLFAEIFAQLGFLLARKVAGDQLEVLALEGFGHAVSHGVTVQIYPV